MARRLTGRPPPPRRSALIAATALQQPVKIHGRGERTPGGRTWCGRPVVSVSTATRLEYVTCAACRARAPER